MKLLVLYLFTLFATNSYAQRLEKYHPVNVSTAAFFDDSTELDLKKVEIYKQSIVIRLEQVFKNMERNLTLAENKTRSESLEIIKNHPTIFSYEQILKYINILETDRTVNPIELVSKIIDLDKSTKMHGKDFSFNSYYSPVLNFSKKISILKNTNENIKEFKSSDLRYTDYLRIDSLQEGQFQVINKFYHKTLIKLTEQDQSHSYLELNHKNSFQVIGNKLATMLGINTLDERLVKKFKLIFENELDYNSFIKNWNDTFPDLLMDEWILSIGETAFGTKYIIFKEVILSKLPAKSVLLNLHSSLQNHSEKEMASLFNLWINNNIEEVHKGNLLLLPKDKDYDFYYLNNSFQYAFQNFIENDENEYPLLDSLDSNEIKLNFSGTQKRDQLLEMSYINAKEMASRISILSIDEIHKSIKSGMLTSEEEEKILRQLIHRRNELVKAFDLDMELLELEINHSLPSLSAQDGKTIFQDEFDNYLESVGIEMQGMLKTAFESTQSIVSKAAILAANNLSSIIIDGKTLGFDINFISEVEISANKKVIKNLNSQGLDDTYLVEDHVRIRFSLGVGLVVKGKVNYIKNYKLVYPVKSREDGLENKNYIFNALLPHHLRELKMPSQYVLVMDDAFEGEGEILLSGSPVPIAFGVSKIYGIMCRLVLSKKENEYRIFKDVSPYRALVSRLYAELYILRIPVWENIAEIGHLERYTLAVDLDTNKESKMLALDSVLMTGNISEVEKIATKSSLKNNFVLQKKGTNLFGLYQNFELRRVDNIETTIYETNGDIKNNESFQLNIDRKNEWSFFGNGEVKNKVFRLSGRQTNQQNKDFSLELMINIEDKDTHSIELERSYIPMINQMALSRNFVNFTPGIHTDNNKWGHTSLDLKLTYNQRALDKILNIDIDDLHKQMAIHSNMPKEFWATSKKRLNIDKNSLFIKKKYNKFIELLIIAQSAVTPKMRYMSLVDALDLLIWRKEDGYSFILFEKINDLIGIENYSISAMISSLENNNYLLSGYFPIYNERNIHLAQKFQFKEFNFLRANEIWSALN